MSVEEELLGADLTAHNVLRPGQNLSRAMSALQTADPGIVPVGKNKVGFALGLFILTLKTRVRLFIHCTDQGHMDYLEKSYSALANLVRKNKVEPERGWVAAKCGPELKA